MKFNQYFKNRLELDSKLRKLEEKYSLKREISLLIINQRITKGLTQAQLAKKLKTQQPSIARLEQGSNLPSIFFLEKIAQALGMQLILDFAPKNLKRIEINQYFKYIGNTKNNYSGMVISNPQLDLHQHVESSISSDLYASVLSTKTNNTQYIVARV